MKHATGSVHMGLLATGALAGLLLGWGLGWAVALAVLGCGAGITDHLPGCERRPSPSHPAGLAHMEEAGEE